MKGNIGAEILDKILCDLLNSPRDLKTIPLERDGRWFYAYVNNGNIYVDKAKTKTPSSELKQPQKLKHNEINKVYSIYLRRLTGERVSYEATAATRHQVYWYSVFYNCL